MQNTDIKKELLSRNLPDLFTMNCGAPVTESNVSERRSEMLEILQNEIYGIMPKAPDEISFTVLEVEDKRCCAGKAIFKKVNIAFCVSGGHFDFDVKIMLPKNVEKPPFVVIANFRENLPDEYIPAEELIDKGIGFGVFCYKTDITTDDNDFSDKLAGVFYPDGNRRAKTDCGKIALWAYCESRVLDYVLENESVDVTRISSAGHSRLGKTALVAAAFDERFTHAYSNDSGCSGAAITRNKDGENVEYITRVFPFWFCEKYKEYADKENTMPFDQHFLLACIAPRKVYIASAVEDTWADPFSEYLSCCAAGDFWKLYGKSGYPYENIVPEPQMSICGENIGYHIRHGVHYWSRTDWNLFLDFFLK